MTVHHRVRTLTVNVVLVTATVWSLSGPAAAQESTSPVRRVRSGDPSIAALIERAITDSPTFERLVGTVEASDGIVYVHAGRCRGGVVACLPMWMTSSASNRLMRIVVDRERIDSDGALLGAIGHELQHAIEVLSDRFVTNGTKMYFFYLRYAPTGKERFETRDATDAGIAVGRELRAWRKGSQSVFCAAEGRRLEQDPGCREVLSRETGTGPDLPVSVPRCLGASVPRCVVINVGERES